MPEGDRLDDALLALGDVCVRPPEALEERCHSALQREIHREQRNAGRGIARHRGNRILGGVVLALAMSGGAAYAGGLLDSAPRPIKIVPIPYDPVTSFSTRQLARFPAFARAASDADVLPADAATPAGPFNLSHANFSLSRRILSDSLGSVYLLPGRDQVCMLITTAPDNRLAGGGCGPDGLEAAKGTIVFGGNSTTVTGLAPAGATSVTITSSSSTVTSSVTADGGFRAELPRGGTGISDLKFVGPSLVIDEPMSSPPAIQPTRP